MPRRAGQEKMIIYTFSVKYISRAVIAAAMTLNAGCIFKFDTPNLYEYELWKSKTNGDLVEVVILECGYPSIFGSGKYHISEESEIYFSRCMKKSGFNSKEDYGRKICSRNNRPKACSDDYTPSRSIKKRTSSPYCHQYPRSKYCEP